MSYSICLLKRELAEHEKSLRKLESCKDYDDLKWIRVKSNLTDLIKDLRKSITKLER